ncbi:MAG: response regulator transcription factor [Culturomica sp.]|jgi:DNA-binding response OmpR family regulator|nr:response regulator transcription factor [Culturomica sp.]
MKVLIIEDDPDLREIMQKFLTKEKYIVETVANYKDALIKTADYAYDCILLDIMLPDGSGLDLLRKLKEWHKSDSVIIISAKDSLDDKITGLDLGADDYLAKPFHLSELSARIRSLMRRNKFKGEMLIEAGNLKLLPDNHDVTVNGKSLELNRKEFDILNYFLSRSGMNVNKSDLAESVWGDHIDMVDNYDFLYAQIKNLRKKLKESGAGIDIKAVYGYGYKLIEE